MEGLIRLVKTITGELPLGTLPIDIEESELVQVLEELESCDLRVFSGEGTSAKRLRANLRYLAALWPEASVTELAQNIHALINNRNLVFADVMTVLRGERLSDRGQLDDLRTILNGGAVGSAGRAKSEVPVPIIQGIGKCLRDGKTMAETSRSMRVSLDTVRRIESVVGLHARHRQRVMSAAIDAVRDGVSIREFARQNELTRSNSENILRRARGVLQELGEIK